MPVNATELTGANVWLLNWLADLGGFGVDYEVYKLPQWVDQAWLDAGNDTAVIINYLFYNATSSRGRPYDCVVTGTKQDALRATTMDFLVAHQPYTYLLATFIPDPLKTLISHTLTTWADPFSRQARERPRCAHIAAMRRRGSVTTGLFFGTFSTAIFEMIDLRAPDQPRSCCLAHQTAVHIKACTYCLLDFDLQSSSG